MLNLFKSFVKPLISRKILVIPVLLLVLVANAQQALNYDEAIIYGDRKLKESALLDAKAYYQMALKFKPEDAYATKKVDEIVAKLQAKMESEEAYYDFVDKADEFYEAGKLNMAILQYQKALEVIPGDEHATSQIQKIIEFQASQKEKLENYDRLMKEASELTSKKDYDDAINKLKDAQGLFPENSEPTQQLAVVNTLKTEWLDKQQRCNEKMEEASRYILINNYVTSLEMYEEALAINPESTEALAKINEIKPLAEKQKRYNRQVEKADEFYVNKDFIAAKTEYEVAKKLWPEKTYADDMLGKIDEQLAAQMKDLDKNFALFIKRGDSLYNAAAYTEAKGEYSLALNLKPNESYPKAQLAAIEQYFAGQQEAMEENYRLLVNSADSAFNASAYAVAKEKYLSALDVKPEDPYPQGQLDAIALKTKEMEEMARLETAYQNLISEADRLASDGQYDLSMAKYREAQTIKTTETYPTERIAAIELMLADAKKMREMEEKYQAQAKLAQQLFDQDKLLESKESWATALAIKPTELLPKEKMATIDSLIVLRAKQAEIQKQYDGLLASGDSLQQLESYEQALEVFAEAMAVKPDGEEAPQRIEAVKAIQLQLEREAARKKSYEESIAKADALLQKENYEMAKSEYETAVTFADDATYANQRISEINELLVKLAAEREQRYKDAVASGTALFDEGKYKEALEEFNVAASIKPGDAFVVGKIAECDAKIAERMKAIMAEYNQAITEADKLYDAKIYDKAIAAYKKAQAINPDETYPTEMVTKITTYIEENAITDILNSSLTVASKTTKKLEFAPVPVNVRKSNYILVKAKSLNGQPASVIFSYGSAAGKNGGFVVPIPEGEQSNDFIIRVGNQYKWFSEDNDWLEIYPENGDIELTLVRISTSN